MMKLAPPVLLLMLARGASAQITCDAQPCLDQCTAGYADKDAASGLACATACENGCGAADEAARHEVCLSGCETDVSPEYNVQTCIAACAYWDGGTVQVLKQLFDAGNPGPVLLGACLGDCDNDAECEAGLKCFQRNAMQAVPGCSGAGTNGWDYCLDPTIRPDHYVAEVGNNNIPSTAFPLEECAGDCDNDGECAPGLRCHQRGGGEPVAGCYGAIGEALNGGSDFCFDPSKTDEPTGSPSWSPTTGTPTVTRQFWNFDVYGEQAPIVDIRAVEYDQNQNYEGATEPIFSEDETSLTVNGNIWTAWSLTSPIDIYADSILKFDFVVSEITEDGFVAICLDYDVEVTGDNGACFVLNSSQGWISDMINVPGQTAALGETSSHSIPVGQFLGGKQVKYLAILQDSDGADRSLGSATFSDLMLVQHDTNSLEIEVDGEAVYLDNAQLEYRWKDGSQDTSQFKMNLAEDGKSLQINGNSWKALAIPARNVTTNTVIELDVVVDSDADFIAIFLTDTLEGAPNSNRHAPQEYRVRHGVVLQNPRENNGNWRDDVGGILTNRLVTGEPRRVTIPYGVMMELDEGQTREVTYIAFVQDDDVGDKTGSRSTWSGIRIYEQDRDPLSIELFGQTVSVTNIQHEMHAGSNDIQDNRDVLMSVSNDGKTITATGNTWKYVPLPSPIEVTKDTVLKFDFDLVGEGELHFFCLLPDNYSRNNDGRLDCFGTAGSQSFDSNVRTLQPFRVMGTTTYEYLVGSEFTGTVGSIGFGLDNDADKLAGQSSWANIEVFNLPEIVMGLALPDTNLRSSLGISDDYISIKNIQLQYDTSQDTGPIKSNLAVVSPEHNSIQFLGNMWRAWELTTPLSPSSLGDFIVSFDFEVAEKGEIHAICFEENREYGNADDPKVTGLDPRRCIAVGLFQDLGNVPDVFVAPYLTPVGGSHHYVFNLSKMFERLYNDLNYLAFVSDNDVGDKSGGNVTFSNIMIHTEVSSCLKDIDFDFNLDDCSVDNFLAAIGNKMTDIGCVNADPFMEMFAFWDATSDTEVTNNIETICANAYQEDAVDFSEAVSLEGQLVGEFIDGGSAYNYGSNQAKDASRIKYFDDKFASSRVLTYPDHHALDRCDIGAAMCCFVTSTGASAESPAPSNANAEACYTDIKASRYSAHVRNGYSIYPSDGVDDIYCEGFAWGTDKGSVDAGLKGNELFKVGFMNNFYTNGLVEQVPAAPMCGCLDRMPVVTESKCMEATAASSSVTVTYDSTLEDLGASVTLGAITYSECSEGNLLEHYKALAAVGKAGAEDVTYMESRIVGGGNCPAATGTFLATLGLTFA